MARLRADRLRVETLVAIVQRNNRGPDLSRLNEQQLAIYREWKIPHQKWRQQFTQPDAAYAAMIDGSWEGPTLPPRVYAAIYGEPIRVTAENAREIYEGMRM